MPTFLSVKNNAASTLAANITDTATSLTVATGEGARFPDSNFHITIEDEILKCTTRTGDVLTVTRAQEATVAAAHAAAKAVRLNITAKAISDLNTAVGDTAHSTLTTGIHGVGSKHLAAIESAGAEAPLKTDTLRSSGGVFFHCDFQTVDKWTLAVGGSGSKTYDQILRQHISTGATADSYARFYIGGIPNLDISSIKRSFYTRVQEAFGSLVQPSTHEVFIFLVDESATLPPTLISKHIGWKIIDGNLWATNADGTTETATDTGIDITSNWQTLDLLLEFNSSEMKFFVNGILKATHTTNFPTGVNHRIYYHVTNPASAANRELLISTCRAKLE